MMIDAEIVGNNNTTTLNQEGDNNVMLFNFLIVFYTFTSKRFIQVIRDLLQHNKDFKKKSKNITVKYIPEILSDGLTIIYYTS